MSATGIFGGTFDPVHTGHLITAQAVKEIRNLDKVIFIPAFISPLKMEKRHSLPQHRLEMIKLAVKDIPYFDYSDIEIKKETISYTIDTLIELKKVYNEIELIVGYDNLLVFEEWKDPGRIFELAKVVVLNRKTDSKASVNKYFDKAVFVDTPVVEISSTYVRQRAAEGLPINFLVPDIIKHYIYKNKLYRNKH